MGYFHMWHKWTPVWEGVWHAMALGFERYLHGHLARLLQQILLKLCPHYHVRSITSAVLGGNFNIWLKWSVAWEGILYVMTWICRVYNQKIAVQDLSSSPCIHASFLFWCLFHQYFPSQINHWNLVLQLSKYQWKYYWQILHMIQRPCYHGMNRKENGVIWWPMIK